MPKTTKLPEVMGAKEACETLGVLSANLRKIKELPEPRQLASGPVWRADEIRRLAEERKGKPTDLRAAA